MEEPHTGYNPHSCYLGIFVSLTTIFILDAPTRAISPKSMPSGLSPASANLAASIFRYMGTVHLYVYKPDENGEQIKQ